MKNILTIMMNYLKKINNYIKDIYYLSPKDIFVLSYPKSGNTRIRMALAYYYYLIENNLTEFDFNYLNLTQVEFGQGKIKEARKRSPFKNNVIFIKTHRIFVVKYFSKKNKIVYISRPSLETLVSYHEYKINRNITYNLTFNEFLSKKNLGSNYFLKHLKFGVKSNSLKILYSNLINTPHITFKSIMDYSELNYDYKYFKQAITKTERKRAVKFINHLDSENYSFTKKKNRKIDDYFNQSNLDSVAPLLDIFKFYNNLK